MSNRKIQPITEPNILTVAEWLELKRGELLKVMLSEEVNALIAKARADNLNMEVFARQVSIYAAQKLLGTFGGRTPMELERPQNVLRMLIESYRDSRPDMELCREYAQWMQKNHIRWFGPMPEMMRKLEQCGFMDEKGELRADLYPFEAAPDTPLGPDLSEVTRLEPGDMPRARKNLGE